MDWPEPTANIPFGSYILEVISNQQGWTHGNNQLTSNLLQHLNFLNMPSRKTYPEQQYLHQKLQQWVTMFRVFVQTSSDGLLIGDDPKSNSRNITRSLTKWTSRKS